MLLAYHMKRRIQENCSEIPSGSWKNGNSLLALSPRTRDRHQLPTCSTRVPATKRRCFASTKKKKKKKKKTTRSARIPLGRDAPSANKQLTTRPTFWRSNRFWSPKNCSQNDHTFWRTQLVLFFFSFFGGGRGVICKKTLCGEVPPALAFGVFTSCSGSTKQLTKLQHLLENPFYYNIYIYIYFGGKAFFGEPFLFVGGGYMAFVAGFCGGGGGWFERSSDSRWATGLPGGRAFAQRLQREAGELFRPHLLLLGEASPQEENPVAFFGHMWV